MRLWAIATNGAVSVMLTEHALDPDPCCAPARSARVIEPATTTPAPEEVTPQDTTSGAGAGDPDSPRRGPATDHMDTEKAPSRL